MQEGLPLYNGELPVAAQQKFVSVPQLPQGQLMGAAFDAAVDDGLRIVDTYKRLHDFAEEQRVEHQLRLNDRKMQEELFQAQNARWGSKGSFFNADGSVNEDNVAAFCSRWQEANSGIERTFLRRDNAIRDAGRMSRQNDDLSTRVELSTMRQALANGKKAFEANYAEAMASGDHAGAARAVAGAVESGHISDAEGRLMLNRARQGAARKNVAGMPPSARINSLLEAEAPAATAETPTATVTEPPVDTGSTLFDGEATGAEENNLLFPSDDEPMAETPSPVQTPDGLTAQAETQAELDLSLDDGLQRNLDRRSTDWTQDESVVRDVMNAEAGELPVEERNNALIQALAEDKAVKVDEQTGSSSINSAAPAAAVLAVDAANAAGGWTRDKYKELAYALGNELVNDDMYKHLSNEEMEKLIRKTVTVEGLEEQLFAGEIDPKAAYSSFVNGMVSNMMAARNGEVQKRVTAAFSAGKGTEDLELPEDEYEAQYVLMRACEEYGKYLADGNERNWFEEQDVISKAVADAKAEYAENGYAEAWAKHRKSQEAVALAETKKREENVGIARRELRAAQEASAKKKAEEDAAKKAAKKNPAQPKKPTKAELLKERPYLGEVQLQFNYAANDSADATLTVPKAQYEAMCRQFDLKDDEVLYCNFGGNKLVRVQVGDVKGCSVNNAAVHVLMRGVARNKLDAAVNGIKRGSTSVVKFRKVKAN